MIVVFGGYGIFGSHVARSLAAAGLRVRIAGRDAERAERFAADLGTEHEGVAADANDPASCAGALRGVSVAVNCAGPFSTLSATLPDSCLAAGIHYVDIADDRGWMARLRARDAEFRARGLAAAIGCSSLPGISGALAVLAARRLPAVERVRVTLFIGNRNPKGDAAVHAALAQLARSFPAPQGTLRGFRGREIVDLPPPFGPRAVYDWESPELDLFPALLGARSVRVKVGFEARLATRSFAAAARLGPHFGRRSLSAIAPLARRLSGFGHSGGCVKVELFAPDGTCAAASIGGAEDGQRLAALPAAFVAQGLADGSVNRRGAMTAYEALEAQPLIDRLVQEGFEFLPSL
jgi:NAD(P)-dependent dehydrogenase (short-subunit alcohol dehydrogenase family)